MKITFLIALSVITAACGSEIASDPSSSVPDVTEGATEAVEADVIRFDFVAPDIDTGTVIEGTELYEMRPLIISFVVPTCGVCIEEGPELAKAAEENPDITFVFVHSNADVDAYQDYVLNAQIAAENTIHLQDNSAELWDRFGVSEQPSTAIVNSDGLVSVSTGALGATGLEAAVDKALNG